jgi:flagellar basal-body rod protein FlgB
MEIFDRTMTLLEESMNLRATRHRVIAQNIANEETPGFRAKEVQFLDELSAAAKHHGGVALQATHARHLGVQGDPLHGVRARVSEIPSAELPLDANSVNLDSEMAKLADNGLHYNGAATILSVRFKQLLDAVRNLR